MLEIGDVVFNGLIPEECNPGIVVSRESETVFVVDYINRITGEGK